MEKLIIRKARPEDSGLLLHFIRELAKHQNADHLLENNEKTIKGFLSGEGNPAGAILCLNNDFPIGHAVYFYNYSTWLGKKGLYLEDLYVAPEYRNSGAGQAMLRYLAQMAIENDCCRFEWSVLEWNKQAIRFYEKIGAHPKSEWITYRLDGNALSDFAWSCQA